MRSDMNIFGLLGYPLGHSLSPILHNSIYREFNINAAYTIFDVTEDKLADAVNSIKTLKIKGANVTIPYKEKIIQYLDAVSTEASTIGAVNTIKNNGGRLEGYNTDYFGFTKSLSCNDIDVNNKHVFIIGTGGASKAVILSLLKCNSKVAIFGRDVKRAEALRDGFLNISDSIYCYDLSSVNEKLQSIKPYMIVNCTPIGMKGYSGSMDLHSDAVKDNVKVMYDLVYNPLQTEFLQTGSKYGCKTVSGIDMLILQALESIYIWTGHRVDFNYGKKLLYKEGFIDNL